ISYINEPSSAVQRKKTHRCLLREELEQFFVAASQVVHINNPDRVIKNVDGDFDPPTTGLPDNHCYCLWYDSHCVRSGKLNKPGFPGWRCAQDRPGPFR
ncbi:MAG: hypothetical protein QF749_15255, partial [Verrucomicrobiota bacterium]|nr:hypothetical protein [Verrucomicrobiota bacterium]